MRALNCQWLLTALSRSSCCLSLRYGDYPKLPDRSQHERDPWYEWDHTDLRLNWGEPVRKPLPILLSLRVLRFARTLFSSCSTFLLSFSAQGSSIRGCKTRSSTFGMWMEQTGNPRVLCTVNIAHAVLEPPLRKPAFIFAGSVSWTWLSEYCSQEVEWFC